MNLSLSTARSVLNHIHLYTPSDFDTLGINKQDFELATQSIPWRRDQIHKVMRTLNALIFGSLEVLGMPKIVVPSEYVAPIIATFVHPTNRMVACLWLSQERMTGAAALELSARGQTASQIDPTSADELFSLVVQLSDTDEAAHVAKEFKKKLGLVVEEATKNGAKK